MIRLEIVPTQFIYHVWDNAEPFITKGLARSGGDYSAEQLKVMLTKNEQTLGIFIDDNKIIHGAVTLQFINYPNNRVAFVTSIGGKALADQDIYKQFEDWLRLQGATILRGAAVESVARLWRKHFGAQTRYQIVEKKL